MKGTNLNSKKCSCKIILLEWVYAKITSPINSSCQSQNVEKLSDSKPLHLYQYSLKSCQIPKKRKFHFPSSVTWRKNKWTDFLFYLCMHMNTSGGTVTKDNGRTKPILHLGGGTVIASSLAGQSFSQSG